MKLSSYGNGTAPEMIVKLRLPLRLPWAVPPEDIRVIGIVHRGLEYGFLGQTPKGEYLQINGSMTQRLNAAQVEQARYEAVGTKRDERHGDVPQVQSRTPALLQPSVVTVRKKRRILAPDAATHVR